MKKKPIILSVMAMLCITMAQADDGTSVALVSVQQGGTTLETAQFELSQKPNFHFDANGKLVMTLGDGTSHIAEMPVKNGGKMNVAFAAPDASINKKSLTVTNVGYATFCSAFQTVVPSGAAVYAPTNNDGRLQLNESTQVPVGAIVPAGTGLIIKADAAIYDFAYSAASATADVSNNALTGSVIALPTSDFDGTIYSLARENEVVAFYQYTQELVKVGKAFLVASAVGAKAVNFQIDDKTTSMEFGETVQQDKLNGKFLENGRIVIRQGNRKFNVNGQEVK